MSPSEVQVRALIYGAPPAPDRPSGIWSLLFSFQGRIGRAKFFWTSCISITPYILCVLAVLAYAHVPITSVSGTLIRLALAPPFVWIGLALTAKRLHDLDLSAKHLLWIMPTSFGGNLAVSSSSQIVSMVASLVLELWLIFKRGTPGPNRYGSGSSAPQIGGIYTSNLVPRRASRGKFVVIPLVLLLAAAGIIFAQGENVIPNSVESSLTCSDPDVLAKVVSILQSGTGIPLLGDYGSLKSVNMFLHSVRTIDKDNPLHGRTCVAMLHVSSPDKAISAFIGDRDSGDVTYTLQTTDENSREYIVKVLSD